jgi:integrase
MNGNGRRLDADLLTPREIEALIKTCSQRAPTGVRNRAMIALAWRTGLRIGEVLALRPKDVDLGSGTLIVQHGKGDKRRVLGVDAGTVALLQRWLDVRRKRGTTDKHRSSPRSRVSRSSSRTSDTCFPVWRERRESRRGFMPMACATPTRSSLKEKALRSARSEIFWGIAAWLLQTGTYGESGPERRSSSLASESGLSDFGLETRASA